MSDLTSLLSRFLNQVFVGAVGLALLFNRDASNLRALEQGSRPNSSAQKQTH